MDRKYYKLLNVQKTSSNEEIKKSYRKLAMKYHPDRGGDPDKFKAITEAYNVLSDPSKKQMYDMSGNFGVNMPNPFNIFEKFASQHADEMFQTVHLTLLEMFKGTKKRIKLYHLTECEKCKGTGIINKELSLGFLNTNMQGVCDKCNGKKHKKMKKYDIICITIPEGCKEGQTLIIDNVGHIPQTLKFKQKKNDDFERKNNNLYTRVNISWVDSFLHRPTQIRNIDNSIINFEFTGCDKDRPIMPGSMWEIPNQGMPYGKDSRGSLLVTIQVSFPSKLNNEQKLILDKAFPSSYKISNPAKSVPYISHKKEERRDDEAKDIGCPVQ